MIFLKWLHRRQDEELLKTAEQVLKDFRNEISSMEVCGEEREVLENMIFLLLNTYMEEDEKKFLCDADGKGCLDTLAAPLVLGENGGTYAASYDRCMEEGQGKYKTFARYFGKDFTPFGFDVFTGMVLLYTRKTGDREEGTQRLLDAADRVLGDWKSFYHSFLFGFFMAAYGRGAVSSAAWLKAADRQILDLLHGFEER